MKQDTKIAYEPHPVSAERKAELRAAGYTIIDEIYKPADAPLIDEQTGGQGGQGGNTSTSSGAEGGGGPDDDDEKPDPDKANSSNPNDLTKKQLVEALKNLGVTAPDNANKATLVELFNKATA